MVLCSSSCCSSAHARGTRAWHKNQHVVCSGCSQLVHPEAEALLLPVLPCHPAPQDIRQDYEGGYVLIAVEHADAPASDWHRGDLFAGSS